jgi:hypothetical protein
MEYDELKHSNAIAYERKSRAHNQGYGNNHRTLRYGKLRAMLRSIGDDAELENFKAYHPRYW